MSCNNCQVCKCNKTIDATPDPKKPEFILAFDRDMILKVFGMLPAFGDSPAQVKKIEFDKHLNDNGVLAALTVRQRQHLDFKDNNDYGVTNPKGDRNYLQLLPYLIVRNLAGQVFTYSRGKNGGEERLIGDRSAGYGGHIEVNDLQYRNAGGAVPDLINTVYSSAHREVVEELEFLDSDGLTATSGEAMQTITAVGLLYDTSNEVGHLHLGMVFIVDLAKGFTVKPREENVTEHGRLVSVEDLKTSEHENWTQLAASYLL